MSTSECKTTPPSPTNSLATQEDDDDVILISDTASFPLKRNIEEVEDSATQFSLNEPPADAKRVRKNTEGISAYWGDRVEKCSNLLDAQQTFLEFMGSVSRKDMLFDLSTIDTLIHCAEKLAYELERENFPEEPKPPMLPKSALGYFVDDKRAELEREFPNLAETAISEKAIELWCALGEDVKSEYFQKASAARVEYDRAFGEYNKHMDDLTSSKPFIKYLQAQRRFF